MRVGFVRGIIMLLVLSVLGTTAYAGGSAEARATERRVRLEIMLGSGWIGFFEGDMDMNDNEWSRFYQDAFPEYDIVWNIVPSAGYAERKNLIMASRDMPDIIASTQNDIVVWADQGLIQPLDDVIAEHIPLWDGIVTPLNSHEFGLYRDQMWAFTSPLNAKHNGPAPYIRQDWLDNLGLDMPTTPEELLRVAEAFTFQDPNRSGKDDTWGMGGVRGLERMNFAFNPFGIVYGYDDWTTVDGKVTPHFILPGMKDSLAYIKQLFDAGVIDPDSFVQDADKQWEKIRQGSYGIFEMFANGVLNVALPAMKQLDESVDMRQIYPPVVGPNGTQVVRTANRSNSGLWTAPITNQHPEAFARVFQWLLEGAADTVNFGNLEGVSYRQVGDFQWEMGRQADPSFYRMNYRLMHSISSHAASDEGVYRFWQTMADNGITTEDYPLFIRSQIEYGLADDYFIKSRVAIDKMPELETYFDELAVDIILGRRPIDAFDTWVEFFYANGGREIIEDATRLNQ